MSSLLLIAWLGLAPPDSGPQELRSALDQAIASAEPNAASALLLGRVLARAQGQAPSLVGEAEVLASMDRARLTLVAVHLALEDLDAAARVMDETIRSAMGRELSPGLFGPGVLELYERRRAALEAGGRGTISIDCRGCEVIINESVVSNPSEELYLGSYRVWARMQEPGVEPQLFALELDEDGEVLRRNYAPRWPMSTEQMRDELPDASEPERGPARMLPRWSELLGVSVGLGVLVTGAILAGIHGKCRGDLRAEYDDLDSCAQLYDNRPQDLALLGVGSALALASGIVLSVDEVRVGRVRGRRAMLTWTLRF